MRTMPRASSPKTIPLMRPSNQSWRVVQTANTAGCDSVVNSPTSAALLAQEYGTGKVVALEEVLRRALEADLSLLEEDGPVGH